MLLPGGLASAMRSIAVTRSSSIVVLPRYECSPRCRVKARGIPFKLLRKVGELSQFPAKHGDRPGWECVHAVGGGGNRCVLILSRGVAILHKSYRADERMADVLVILDGEMNRMGRVQIVVDQHQRPVPVGTFDSVRGDHGPIGSVLKIGRGGKNLVRSRAVLQ